MESQKIINFLEPDDDNNKYFQTKKWYIINDQNNGQYDKNSTIKFNTEVIKQNLCDYSDAYILVIGNVKIINENANDTHVETAENLQLVMKHYNLLEYSQNYQDTVGSLYQFRID